MVAKLQFSRFQGVNLVSVFVALIMPGFALIQGSCRPIEEQPEQVEGRSPPATSQLVDSLIQSGDNLRRLDVLDLEGTAGLSLSERERMRTKLIEVAGGHARKYRDHLLQFAKFSPQRMKDEINISLAANRKTSGLSEIVKVIELHLRLVKVENPPSESRIIWDFGNLRYANPTE